jgi:alkylmercury lyase
MPGTDELNLAQVRATTCNPGRFFATAHAAQDWQAQHPTGIVLPVADAFDQLHPISERVLAATEKPDCR